MSNKTKWINIKIHDRTKLIVDRLKLKLAYTKHKNYTIDELLIMLIEEYDAEVIAEVDEILAEEVDGES